MKGKGRRIEAEQKPQKEGIQAGDAVDKQDVIYLSS